MSGQSSDDIVSAFLEKYAQNGPGAMAELINFILKSAGCDLQVTEDDINDSDNVNGRIADLQQEHQAVGSVYSVMAGPANLFLSKTYLIIH